MPRSTWNKNTPDVVGVEFLGTGVVSHLIQSEVDPRAVRFKAQSSGEIDQVAVYSGPLTNNPVLTEAHFVNHRQPFIVDLYPASGFDLGGPDYIIDTYLSNFTAWSNIVDETGGGVSGDELRVAGDNKFLFNVAGAVPSVTVEFLGIENFPTGRHVSSLRVNLGIFRNMNIRRVDQTGNYLWTRLLDTYGWFIGELRIEQGTSSPWQLWTTTNIRQFSSLSGNRRLRMDGLDGQPQIMDLFTMSVYSTLEKRAGTAIIEPTASWQWNIADLVIPGTSTPATVTSGQEYILLFRPPGGVQDYGGTRRWDASGLKDRRPNGGFVHFSDLDWDYHKVVQHTVQLQKELGELVDGLPSVRLINNNVQTVNTQPYQFSIPMVPGKLTGSTSNLVIRQQLDVPAGATEYSGVRLNVALLNATPNAPADKKSVVVDIVNNADTVIAGPVHITEEVWTDATPTGGNVYNDPMRTCVVNFGSGVNINEAGGVRARVYLHQDYAAAPIAWRVESLISDLAPVTGSDQTAFGAVSGWGYTPPVNSLLQYPRSDRRGDLQVSLLSQAPEITGIGVTGLEQPVTGGLCDPCDPTPSGPCVITSIPYHHVCWPATTLTGAKFGYYELQRQEMAISEEWITIAVIAPTGTIASGAPATGVPTCFDDWTHVYGSEVCYRVRQQRKDGTLSDFVDEACIMTHAPAGADLVILTPDEPELNVAFAEAHGARLPIEHEWTNLDADQVELRPIYGRDNYLSFRPSERLGLRFDRQVLISALCTPVTPCLSVVQRLREVSTPTTGTVVVKDHCGNRWWADVAVSSFTQVIDPELGDLWLANLSVTEVATPVVHTT